MRDLLANYIKSLQTQLVQPNNTQDHSTSTRNISSPTTGQPKDDQAMSNIAPNSNDYVNWHTLEDFPHMELVRQTIMIKPPSSTTEAKTLQVPILELRCPYVKEAILIAKTSTHGHGVFVPTSFFKEDPDAVYKTELRYLHYLKTLKVTPVLGIHPARFDFLILTDTNHIQTFF